MSRKIFSVVVFCFLILGLAQGDATAACREDCFTLCCGGAKVCNEPDKVKCLSDCTKECDQEKTVAKPVEEKSSSLNAQVCRDDNRRRVQACNYPKKTVEATRKCLQDARENYDSCMQGIGR